jgi:hypothetical protein
MRFCGCRIPIDEILDFTREDFANCIAREACRRLRGQDDEYRSRDICRSIGAHPGIIVIVGGNCVSGCGRNGLAVFRFNIGVVDLRYSLSLLQLLVALEMEWRGHSSVFVIPNSYGARMP